MGRRGSRSTVMGAAPRRGSVRWGGGWTGGGRPVAFLIWQVRLGGGWTGGGRPAAACEGGAPHGTPHGPGACQRVHMLIADGRRTTRGLLEDTLSHRQRSGGGRRWAGAATRGSGDSRGWAGCCSRQVSPSVLSCAPLAVGAAAGASRSGFLTFTRRVDIVPRRG